MMDRLHRATLMYGIGNWIRPHAAEFAILLEGIVEHWAAEMAKPATAAPEAAPWPIGIGAWRTISEAVGVEETDVDKVAHAVVEVVAMAGAQAVIIDRANGLLGGSSDLLDTLADTLITLHSLTRSVTEKDSTIATIREAADREAEIYAKLTADLRDALLGGEAGDLVKAANDTSILLARRDEMIETQRNALVQIRKLFALDVDDERDALSAVKLVETMKNELDGTQVMRDSFDATLTEIRAALPGGEAVEDLAEAVRRLVAQVDEWRTLAEERCDANPDVVQTSAPILPAMPIVVKEPGVGLAELMAVARGEEPPTPAVPQPPRPSLPYEDKPAKLEANPPVPSDWPGRGKPPTFVPAAELMQEIAPDPAASTAFSVDGTLRILEMLADGADRKTIAGEFGLADARKINPVAMRHKADIEKLKTAEDRATAMAEIRTRLESRQKVAA